MRKLLEQDTLGGKGKGKGEQEDVEMRDENQKGQKGEKGQKGKDTEKGKGKGKEGKEGEGGNRDRPWNYKTVLCKYYERLGWCNRGENCHFAHGNEELNRW